MVIVGEVERAMMAFYLTGRGTEGGIPTTHKVKPRYTVRLYTVNLDIYRASGHGNAPQTSYIVRRRIRIYEQ